LLKPSDGPVHFIGIGGAGMSPLAEVLLARGFGVSGTDIRASAITERLQAHGAQVRIGHAAEALDGAATVVCSTAIRAENPELQAARERGLPILHRSELLGELLAGKDGIAVAGTHGKSTTSGMIATILTEAGFDPTAIIGAEVRNLGGHHRVGSGPQFVLEACESDSSFLNYPGCSQVLTSLEPDHLDQHHSFENLREVFRKFVALGRPDGFLVYCADSAELRELARHAPGKPVSYGHAEGVEFRVGNVATDVRTCAFDLREPDGGSRRIHLAVPGEHNALNAAAAYAAARQMGVEPEMAARALGAFAGVERRFQVLFRARDMLVVDDYAHHPTEIEATLATARRAWRGRIVAIFQPHLFSRTQLLMDGFARAFGDADEVIIAEIYPAREDPIPGVTGERLAEAVRAAEPNKPVRSYPTKEDIVADLLPRLSRGDMVLSIGAGDIHKVGEALAAALNQHGSD
jgi:UDP-N-acetylmuramate--alanine ligase